MIKKALLFFGLLFSILTVCAEDNVLQSIEIVPIKDTYNIVLTADKSVDIKKNVKAPNKITLDMRGIRAAKTLNTIYNNAADVDTVMVETTGNGVSIYFQAENAENASITFDTLVPAVKQTGTETAPQIKLNSPIDSYAPIYRDDIAQEKTSAIFDKITKKSDAMKTEIQDTVDGASDTMNKVFSYGLLGLLGFGIVRLFKRKEPDMKIGLSQNLNEREIGMYKGMNTITSPEIRSDKSFTNVNYGINAYKKEAQNPYEDSPVQIHNPRLQQYVSPLTRQQQQAQQSIAKAQQVLQAKNAAATMTAPVQQPVKKPHTTPVNTAPVNQNNPNIDNLKFLESMTAIYEKSGRHDLAQGLKASLSKNNIK